MHLSHTSQDTASVNTKVISLIVPIHNQERWLSRCFASIDSQTFFAFETILVDDASTDSSGALAAEYVALHPKAQLVTHDECKGLSAARNAGIAKAQGDYLAFLDSDDWLEPEFLETLYMAAKEHDADVAQVAYVESSTFAEPEQPECEQVNVLSGEDAAAAMLHADKYAVWCRLYRRSLVEKLGEEPFVSGLTCEDRVFNMRVLPMAQTVACSNRVEYHYFQNMGSLSFCGLSEKGMDLLQADNLMVAAAEDSGNEELLELARDRQAKGAYSLLVKWARFGITDENLQGQRADEVLTHLKERYVADYPRLIKSEMSTAKKLVAWQLRYMPSVLKAEFALYNALTGIKRTNV